MLELIAWSGMWVGVALKLNAVDVEDRKVIIRGPKAVKGQRRCSCLRRRSPGSKGISAKIKSSLMHVFSRLRMWLLG